MRNGRLDNICESIEEERARVNAARKEEATLIAAALSVMQGNRIHAYKHAGIELARVPGTEKLRVRLVKDDGDAEVSDGQESSTQEDLEPAEVSDPIGGPDL